MTWMRWIGRGLFAAAVAGIVGVTLPTSTLAFECPGVSPGTCPPLTQGECYSACQQLGYPDGGLCMNPGSQCCTCFE